MHGQVFPSFCDRAHEHVMADFDTAMRLEPQRDGRASADNADILRRGETVVAVVADGAGGTSGGAKAAKRVLERVSAAVETADAPTQAAPGLIRTAT